MPVLPVAQEASASEDSLERPPSFQAFLREPSSEELLELGVAGGTEYEAATEAFREALEGLEKGGEAASTRGQRGEALQRQAQKLRGLSEAYPWHALSGAASFAAIAAWYAAGECRELLRVGEAFMGAWPQGVYASEVGFYMALCRRQQGHRADYERLLRWVIGQYPHTPAGLKARIELGVELGG
ncbi:MAG: hypothetical protein FWD46_05140 [Cystobacterineae bacterium]|nr:hypothetical protein [Cystobacterineae bacterium]